MVICLLRIEPRAMGALSGNKGVVGLPGHYTSSRHTVLLSRVRTHLKEVSSGCEVASYYYY